LLEVSTAAGAPPLVRPALAEQTGQALGRCEPRTFSAAAHRCAVLPWFAQGAYAALPYAAQGEGVNCSRAWKPLAVRRMQLMPASDWAAASQVEVVGAEEGVAVTRRATGKAVTAAPATN
ncbi:hypothetical protein VM98_35020, partial [Streptomyces rubellomurinus subsp. indigoferus]